MRGSATAAAGSVCGTCRSPARRRCWCGRSAPGAAVHFHAIRLASTAVSDARRRVQQDTLGHRGRTADPLYGIRQLLLRTWANLTERGWERLRAGLAAGDPDGNVAAAWLARELLSEVYSARDLAHAKRRLTVFFQHAADARAETS